jgi:hypothetical protein
MSPGYFEASKTVEQRVWEIAYNAELILEMPGIANKIYDYAGRGW